MKRKLSKGQHHYLAERGLLEADQETIRTAMKEYRTAYKRQWKEDRKGLRKDIRIAITLKEYSIIRYAALQNDQSVPCFVKTHLLALANGRHCAPDKEFLLQMLQFLSMNITASKDLIAQPLLNLFIETEQSLLKYIDSH